MATDDSLRSARAALEAGDVAGAQRQFFALPITIRLASSTYLLKELLRDSYAGASVSLGVALDFLGGLEHAEWKLTGCGILHGVHVMQQACTPFANVPVFRLAAFVEEAIVAKLRGDERALKPLALMRMYEWFGPTVCAIVRRQTIRIESLLDHEVLYAAANGLKFDATRRCVFTWCRRWSPGGNRGEHLMAEPLDDSWTRFALRSVPYNEYFLADLVDGRRRVFSVEGYTLADVGPCGTWELRARDGIANRNVWKVYNRHFNESLEATRDFFYHDTKNSPRVMTTGPPLLGDENNPLQQWFVMPLKSLSKLDRALEAFFAGNYTEAEGFFDAPTDPTAALERALLNGVFRLAGRLRGGQSVVDELKFETLKSLGGLTMATRLGLQGLWHELAAAVDQQRDRDAAVRNPHTNVDRQMLRGRRLAATCAFEQALDVFANVTQIANDERMWLEKTTAHARLERAKVLFALHRFSEARGELETQITIAMLPNELAARVLLWTATCMRHEGNCDWQGILKLMCRAYGKLPASDAVAVGLRTNIVLELMIATQYVASPPPTTPTRAIRSSAEQVVEMCRCPISLEVMSDPMVAPSGVSYERATIEQHLDEVGDFDPMTHASLTRAQLFPNRVLKQLVETTLSAFDPTTLSEETLVADASQ